MRCAKRLWKRAPYAPRWLESKNPTDSIDKKKKICFHHRRPTTTDGGRDEEETVFVRRLPGRLVDRERAGQRHSRCHASQRLLRSDPGAVPGAQRGVRRALEATDRR